MPLNDDAITQLVAAMALTKGLKEAKDKGVLLFCRGCRGKEDPDCDGCPKTVMVKRPLVREDP